jgi:drug/metabolite transporter (DMT)-like permease
MRAALTTLVLVSLALLAFAGNSLLARAALADGAIEAGAFSAIRLTSGALFLLPVIGRRPRLADAPGALALAVYVAGFSLAYLSLEAGLGALILFACVQATILVVGTLRGERLGAPGWIGLALALTGLFILLAPEAGAASQSVPLGPAMLMASAGVAWGAYTLIGRGSADATGDTARNFLLAALLVAPMLAFDSGWPRWDGALLAIVSGTLTSALGYVLWYMAIPRLSLAAIASVQLGTPVVAALGGVVLLGESAGWRLIAGGAIILGGIVLTLFKPRHGGGIGTAQAK